jgi:hypothetical protein
MRTFEVHMVYTSHHSFEVEANTKEEAYQKAVVLASSLDFEYGSLDCDVENDVIDVTED